MVWKSNFVPDKDAGWGLIFRLNNLWEKADRRAEVGNYEGWEIVLDRIFSNLMYRNETEVIMNGDNEIEDIKITDGEYLEFLKVKEKIRQARKELFKSKNMPEFKMNKLNLYNILMFYDIWLRKFMQSRDLYLKEVESNPSKALFGGAFTGRGFTGRGR